MSYRIDPTRNSALAFLLGAALVGGALGFTADRLLTRERAYPKWGDEHAMRVLFADELGLSAEQRSAVDTILNAKRRAIQSVLLPVRPTLDSISDGANRQIKKLLDDPQRQTFEKMMAEIKARKAKQQ